MCPGRSSERTGGCRWPGRGAARAVRRRGGGPVRAASTSARCRSAGAAAPGRRCAARTHRGGGRRWSGRRASAGMVSLFGGRPSGRRSWLRTYGRDVACRRANGCEGRDESAGALGVRKELSGAAQWLCCGEGAPMELNFEEGAPPRQAAVFPALCPSLSCSDAPPPPPSQSSSFLSHTVIDSEST